VLTASPLIALAATAPTENGDDPLLSTFNKAAFNDATSNLAASVHAAVLTSARICLDDRFVTRPNEPELETALSAELIDSALRLFYGLPRAMASSSSCGPL